MIRLTLALLFALATTACMPAGDPPGAPLQLGPVSAGPGDNMAIGAGEAAPISLDDTEAPGVLATDGIIDVCPGALIAAQATVVGGAATLRAEFGQRDGPWTPFVEGRTIPLHTVPAEAEAVRVVALAGPAGAELAGSAVAPRPTHVTVIRSCQQGGDRPGSELEADAGTDGGGEDDEPHGGAGLVGAIDAAGTHLTAIFSLLMLGSVVRLFAT